MVMSSLKICNKTAEKQGDGEGDGDVLSSPFHHTFDDDISVYSPLWMKRKGSDDVAVEMMQTVRTARKFLAD